MIEKSAVNMTVAQAKAQAANFKYGGGDMKQVLTKFMMKPSTDYQGGNRRCPRVCQDHGASQGKKYGTVKEAFFELTRNPEDEECKLLVSKQRGTCL